MRVVFAFVLIFLMFYYIFSVVHTRQFRFAPLKKNCIDGDFFFLLFLFLLLFIDCYLLLFFLLFFCRLFLLFLLFLFFSALTLRSGNQLFARLDESKCQWLVNMCDDSGWWIQCIFFFLLTFMLLLLLLSNVRQFFFFFFR